MNMVKIPLTYGGSFYVIPQNVRGFHTQRDGSIKVTLAGKGQFTTPLSEEELMKLLDVKILNP